MADPFSIIFGAAGLGLSIFGQSQSDKVSKEQAKANEYSLESTLYSYEHQIEQIDADLANLNADKTYAMTTLGEHQADFTKGQHAAMGAAGAVMGATGTTPLSTMETTQLKQERDMSALERTMEAKEAKLLLEQEHLQEELGRGDTLYEELYGKKRGDTQRGGATSVTQRKKKEMLT